MRRRDFWTSSAIIVLAAACAQGNYWAQSYYHEWRDLRCHDAHRTSDGGYVMAGGVDYAIVHGLGNRIYLPQAYLVLKLDDAGAISWQKMWPASPFSSLTMALCIQEVSDGGFVVAGFTLVYDDPSTYKGARFEIPIVKFDPGGSIVWQRMLANPDFYLCASSMAATDDDLMIAGYIMPNASSPIREMDILLMKIRSSDGAILSQKAYDYDLDEHAVSITPGREGGFLVAGNIEETKWPNKPHSIFALEVEGDASLRTEKAFLFPAGAPTAGSIRMVTDDEFVLAGSLGTGATASSILAMKAPLGSSPHYDWAYAYEIYYDGPKRLAYGQGICQDVNGDLAVAGSCTTGVYYWPGFLGSTKWGYLKHAVLLKLAKNGLPHWVSAYGGPDIDVFNFAEAFQIGTSQAGILVGGTSESFPPYSTTVGASGERMWLMKLNLSGFTDYKMSCMLQQASLEFGPVQVRNPNLVLTSKKTEITATELEFDPNDFRAKPHFLCP